MPVVAKTRTSKWIENLRINGEHAVGNPSGLYILVDNLGKRKSWIHRYVSPITKQRRKMGLGSYPVISLSDVRDHTRRNLELIHIGLDPMDERKRQTRENRVKALTFKEILPKALNNLIDPSWNEKHVFQWRSGFEKYVVPKIGSSLIQTISHVDIAEVLQQEVVSRENKKKPLWEVFGVTAEKIRGRLERVFDYAISLGIYEKENPASKKLLNPLLKRTTKTVKRMSCVPWSEIPIYSKLLYKTPEFQGKEQSTPPLNSYMALFFLLLTSVRSGSVRQAKWDEIDFRTKTWEIPSEHEKNRKFFKVPLSTQVIELLKRQKKNRLVSTDLIFPNQSTGKPFSDMALTELTRGLKKRFELSYDHVPHGFRSSFSDYIAERTMFADDLKEACLGHETGNKVKDAYQRGDLLNKRRAIMQNWADYCFSKIAKEKTTRSIKADIKRSIDNLSTEKLKQLEQILETTK